jgi:hypothetical protein
MPATYEPIATTTLGSNAQNISFTSISSAYTDLRIVFVGTGTTNDDFRLRYNNDTGTNYSRTDLYANGATASSARAANAGDIRIGANDGLDGTIALATIDIFSYTGSTNKTCLITYSHDKNGSGYVYRTVGLWRNTAAITTITLNHGANFATGTTATLYGIKNA